MYQVSRATYNCVCSVIVFVYCKIEVNDLTYSLERERLIIFLKGNLANSRNSDLVHFGVYVVQKTYIFCELHYFRGYGYIYYYVI